MRYVRMSGLSLTAVVLAAIPVATSAQDLTPEIVVDLRVVTGVSMQPQGDYVAYTLRVPRGPEEDPGGTFTELWVVPTGGGEPRQFTAKPVSISSPGWLPDGSMITFLSHRRSVDPNTQVYSIALAGGEAMRLSHAARSISRYALSPDGAQLAYTMRDAFPEEVREARRRGFDQHVEDTWHTVTRLHVEDLRTGATHVVSTDNVHILEIQGAVEVMVLLGLVVLKDPEVHKDWWVI